jgi:hypothetical protein
MGYEIKTENVSWNEFIEHVRDLPKNEWLFKGLLDEWVLDTTIERQCRKWKINLKHLPQIEFKLMRDFQRKYPDTAPKPEPKEDYLWWLALMQHHGAPTRLLDWTYSPYVASYFAFEYALLQGNNNSKAAICAVNRKGWFDIESKSIVEKILEDENCEDKDFFRKLQASEPNTFKPLLMKKERKRPFLCVLNPWRLNQRLAIQQGVFMIPGDISKPFMENMRGMDGWDNKNKLVKYVVESDIKEIEKVLSELYAMNMSRNTLFPGLDGYAASLNMRIKFFKDLWVPEDSGA